MNCATNECWRDLADAVVLTAVDDWRKSMFQLMSPSLRSKRAFDLTKDCEKFFRSSWFETLTGIDGKSFFANVRKGYGFSNDMKGAKPA